MEPIFLSVAWLCRKLLRSPRLPMMVSWALVWMSRFMAAVSLAWIVCVTPGRSWQTRVSSNKGMVNTSWILCRTALYSSSTCRMR